MRGSKDRLRVVQLAVGKREMDFIYLKNRRGNGWVTSNLENKVVSTYR
jgi:hypothetical protein